MSNQEEPSRPVGKLKVRVISLRELKTKQDVHVACVFDGQVVRTPYVDVHTLEWNQRFVFEVKSRASSIVISVITRTGEVLGCMHFSLKNTQQLLESDRWHMLHGPKSLQKKTGQIRLELRLVLPRQVFGVHLEKVIYRPDGIVQVPVVVQKLIQFLSSEEALNHEGLFRVPGDVQEVQGLISQFNEDEDAFEIPANTLINTVASCLKKFFYELPEPLIPFDLYDRFVEIETAQYPEPQRLTMLRNLVRALVPLRHRVIDCLARFLKTVMQHSDRNHMNADNIGLVFGPSFLRSLDLMTMAKDAKLIAKIVASLVHDYDYIFYRTLGAPLDMLLERNCIDGVPRVLHIIVNFIRERGMELEDLFGQSARTLEVSRLRNLLDADEQVEIPDSLSPVTLGHMLRSVLRELPEPLVPTSSYADFIAAGERPDLQRAHYVWKALQAIPAQNKRVLKFICQFLFEVTLKSNLNQSTSKQLGLLFGPNIIRMRQQTMTELRADAPLVGNTMQILIDQSEEVFGDKAPYLPADDEQADQARQQRGQQKLNSSDADAEGLLTEARRMLQEAARSAAAISIADSSQSSPKAQGMRFMSPSAAMTRVKRSISKDSSPGSATTPEIDLDLKSYFKTSVKRRMSQQILLPQRGSESPYATLSVSEMQTRLETAERELQMLKGFIDRAESGALTSSTRGPRKAVTGIFDNEDQIDEECEALMINLGRSQNASRQVDAALLKLENAQADANSQLAERLILLNHSINASDPAGISDFPQTASSLVSNNFLPSSTFPSVSENEESTIQQQQQQRQSQQLSDDAFDLSSLSAAAVGSTLSDSITFPQQQQPQPSGVGETWMVQTGARKVEQQEGVNEDAFNLSSLSAAARGSTLSGSDSQLPFVELQPRMLTFPSTEPTEEPPIEAADDVPVVQKARSQTRVRVLSVPQVEEVSEREDSDNDEEEGEEEPGSPVHYETGNDDEDSD